MSTETMSLLNEDDDMVPPWEAFPTYERYTLGWRMGSGEDYFFDWHTFIEKLSNDYETRLNYLKSHRPAPLNWCDHVFRVLYPGIESEQKYGCSAAETLKLLNLGLIEYDIAYHTWFKQQTGIEFPWSASKAPEDAARYNLREFWFFSRQLSAAREQGNFKIEIEDVPSKWQSVEFQLLTGHLGDINPKNGLLTLSQMLCAGSIQPPWKFSLSPDDCVDSVEMDMGYADAFQLWIMCAFDDDKLLRNMLQRNGIPDDWADWVNENGIFSYT
jgi:hypothetical protein